MQKFRGEAREKEVVGQADATDFDENGSENSCASPKNITRSLEVSEFKFLDIIIST